MIKPVLKYYNLSAVVTAFSSTRHGGYSKGNFGEFNINEYCGDDILTIQRNREALSSVLNIDNDRLVMPHQTHSTNIRQIGPEFFHLSLDVKKRILEDVDGVMTDMKNVCVAVSTADCIPLLIYDAEHHACAAIHAGWRGTVKRIVKNAIEAMALSYNSKPEDLEVCIGPGISLDSFEVGDEVWQEFADAGFDMERISRKYEKWHIDLCECNRIQLMETGVYPDKIQVAGICTYSHSDDFFSARKLTQQSGRILSGILLNQ